MLGPQGDGTLLGPLSPLTTPSGQLDATLVVGQDKELTMLTTVMEVAGSE